MGESCRKDPKKGSPALAAVTHVTSEAWHDRLRGVQSRQLNRTTGQSEVFSGSQFTASIGTDGSMSPLRITSMKHLQALHVYAYVGQELERERKERGNKREKFMASWAGVFATASSFAGFCFPGQTARASDPSCRGSNAWSRDLKET